MKIYEKVILEKDSLTKLTKEISQDKKVLIITSKMPVEKFYQRFINVLKENEINFKTHIVSSDEICSKKLISSICKNYSTYTNLIIGFGGNKVCDITKKVATDLNTDYYLVPTKISHYSYFSNCALMYDDNIKNEVTCNAPIKIYLDETIMSLSEDKYVLNCVMFIFSHLELFVSGKIERMITGEDTAIILNNIYRIILKTEGLLNYLALNRKEAVLTLTEYLVELFYLTKKLNNKSNFKSLALTLLNYSFSSNYCESCFVSSGILIKLYSKFFSQKKFDLNGINFDKINLIIQKLNLSTDRLLEFINDTTSLTSSEVALKLRAIQNCVNKLQDKIAIKNIKLNQKLLSLKITSEKKVIKEEDLFNSINIFPFVYETSLLPKIMFRRGDLNII